MGREPRRHPARDRQHAERTALVDSGQRARLRGARRGVQAARRAVRRVRARDARRGHHRACQRQLVERRRLHGHHLAAASLREPAHDAGGSDPAGARGGRDRPRARAELGGVQSDRAGRSPDRGRQDAGRVLDSAELHRVQLGAAPSGQALSSSPGLEAGAAATVCSSLHERRRPIPK